MTSDDNRNELREPGGQTRNRRMDRHGAPARGNRASAAPRAPRPERQSDYDAPRTESRASYRMPPEALRDEEERFSESGRYMPQRERYEERYNERYYPEEKRGKKKLIVLCAVLLALVVIVCGFALLPEGEDGIVGALNSVKRTVVSAANTVYSGVLDLISPQAKTPAQVFSFQATTLTGAAGSKFTFVITTNATARDVRIENARGDVLIGTVQNNTEENTSSYTYTVDVLFEQPFVGDVFVSAFDGETWTRSDKSLTLTITAATQVPVITPPPATMPPATDVPVTEPPATDAAFVIPTSFATVTPPPPTDVPTPTVPPTIPPTLVPLTQAPAVSALITPPPTVPDAPTMPTDIPATDAPTDVPTQAPTATPEPTATPMPLLPAAAAEGASPDDFSMTERVFVGTKANSEYKRESSIAMPGPDNYMRWAGGVLAFRGDSFRRNAAFGTVEVTDEELEIVWQTELGSLRTADSGTLYGVGWTGQPSIVLWSKQVRQMMNISAEKKEKTALKEVIFGGLDGKIYFLDLADGTQTRDPIELGFPIKSSVTIDTFGMPMLGVGQAISKLANKSGDIGYYLYNLIDQKELLFLNGRQKSTYAYATNGAFDGSALISHQKNDESTLVVAGENGLLYTTSLAPEFKYELDEETDTYSGTLKITPTTVTLKSKVKAEEDKSTGVEASVAMYNQYAYFADTYGALRCVDTDTMKTVWAANVDDNTDAAIALDFDESGDLALYTGNTRVKKGTTVKIRRFDALSGEEMWAYEMQCSVDGDQLSGCKASPVVGQHSISDLVIFTVNQTEDGATMVALDKQTGALEWQYRLQEGAISSPVAVYDEAGNAWIIQADSAGNLHLLNAQSGEKCYELALGGAVQGSPAVYRDMLLIGTCSKDNARMYAVRIK